MEDQAQLLARIASALERIAPPYPDGIDWQSAPAYVWDSNGARPVDNIEAPSLDLLRGIDRQKAAVTQNVARLAAGLPAHDMLLWGARGMGKSALLRAATLDAQAAGGTIALVQVASDAVATLPWLFAQLAKVERNFLVFVDDLGFAEGDTITPRHLRSWLDGGIEARPTHVRLAVTSNRRAILPRHASEQDDPVNPRDAVDDMLALADRFGLSLGFHNASQDDYLAILHGYAKAYGLTLDEGEALEWAKRRGARSGRVAWHFIVELAGREGRELGSLAR
ncbi:ATP-binding protein [Aurantiacibacter poecillastricola]|uniref:ATP-binding protein n=1 Tax=Aurantiacibacter poecillastricola TaxID=3064385 RepID=UPI00273F63A3|nr:ATP-binding protein [Aurantiacibacter sp. 219JJ12-13]MDP5260493.1 ATP-binding protein [Aurantiacibacter sp. 219JJ12-13]